MSASQMQKLLEYKSAGGKIGGKHKKGVKSGTPKELTPWMRHVAVVWKKIKPMGHSYKEALIAAKESYKKGGAKKAATKTPKKKVGKKTGGAAIGGAKRKMVGGNPALIAIVSALVPRVLAKLGI